MVECSVTGSNYCPETENDLTIYYHMCLMISMGGCIGTCKFKYQITMADLNQYMAHCASNNSNR